MTSRPKRLDPSRNLPGHLEKRWYAYALAGAGAIVVPPNAGASVIFTPANTTLNTSCVGSACSDFTAHTLNIDMDNDSTSEFRLTVQASSAGNFAKMKGIPQGTGAGIYHTTNGFGYPALANGATIGPPPANFSYNSLSSAFLNNFTNKDAFLGVRFHLPSDANPADFYYGWIELSSVQVINGAGQTDSMTLKGYAYENTANTPIHAGDTGAGSGPTAPEPGTAGLMLLALGAGGLVAWRKRKQAQRVS
jgi:hypothetical protein